MKQFAPLRFHYYLAAVIIPLLLVAPAGLVVSNKINAEITLTSHEISGLHQIQQLLDIVSNLQELRGLNQMVAQGGDPSIQSRLINTQEQVNLELTRFYDNFPNDPFRIHDDLAKAMTLREKSIPDPAVATSSPRQRFDQDTLPIRETHKIIRIVSVRSGLIHDSTLVAHFLAELVIDDLIDLEEVIGKTRGLGSGFLAKGNPTQADRYLFWEQLGSVRRSRESVEHQHWVIQKSSIHPPPALSCIHDPLMTTVQDFLQLGQTILMGEVNTMAPATFFDSATTAITTLNTCSYALQSELLTSLEQRYQSALELRLIFWIGASFATALVAFFVITFYLNNRSTFDQLHTSQQCIRSTDTVARLGGDEFTVILTNLNTPQEAQPIARKIIDALAAPVTLHAHKAHIGASVGISIYPTDSNNFDAITKYADVAMYHAKESGRGNFKFFEEKMNAHSVKRASLESHLRQALEKDEFILHYQPKISIATQRIVGMESLVRWRRGDGTMVPPGDFIPLAEETGLIIPMGERILQSACRFNKHRIVSGRPPLRVAVNLSARQFQQQDLFELVQNTLAESGLDPQWLELEVTESMMMQDEKQAIALLKKLRDLGIGLSMDDFGTGYSSLSYLKRLPIQALKIDQSFVRELSENSDDAAIVLAIVSMAKSLKLHVVAERVETKEQVEFTRKNRM